MTSEKIKIDLTNNALIESKSKTSQEKLDRFQLFGVLKPVEDKKNRIEYFAEDLEAASTNSWTPSSSGLGYGMQLEYILFKSHFEWLFYESPSFPGRQTVKSLVKQFNNVDAIKIVFVENTTNASLTLVKNLNKSDIEMVMVNAIAALPNNIQQYEQISSRIFFLVDNYNPSTQTADGVGALNVGWKLTISEKDKSFDTNLKITARSVLYGSATELESDYEAAKAHFENI